MDWQNVLIDSGLLQAILTALAIVVAVGVKAALAKWAKLQETSTAAQYADTLVRAAWQLFPDSQKQKMKVYAVGLLQSQLKGLTAEQAEAFVEAAVVRYKQELK